MTLHNTNNKRIGVLGIGSRAIFILSVLLVATTVTKTVSSQEIVDGKKIIVLYPHSDSTLFREQFNSGLSDYLFNVQEEFPNIKVSNELLGLNKPNAAARTDALAGFLKEDQQLDPASAIVSVLSPTAGFLDVYGDEIYADTPRVYVLADQNMAGDINGETSVETSVIPNATPLTIQQTVSTIGKLLPNTENLYIVSGAQAIDLEYIDMVTAFSNEIIPQAQVNVISGLTVSELSSRLSDLPENSVIFMLTYFMDRNGTLHRTPNVLREIFANVNAPVFSYVGILLSVGSVGGSISDIRLTGRLAAEMAISLLSGTEIEDKLMSTKVTAYRFNQQQLQRWNIDESLLPPDSIIENQQLTFLDIYGRQLLILCIVVAVFLFFVFFLKRQAKILGTQKTFFESVINSIPDAILVTDVDSRIFATNKGAAEVFGFDQAKMLGMNTRELIDQTGASQSKIQGDVSSLQSSIDPAMLTYKNQEGKSFSGETIATKIISASGEALGHFALIRDVSKRLSLEEEHRQGQKMEALGNLVGGISHDFNNILGVITGYAELSSYQSELVSLHYNQSQILKATNRAKSLVSQIMTFSRDKAVEQEVIDLNLLLEETIELVRISIPGDIEVVVNNAGGAFPIIGSAIQLQQILLNLTTNAYQSMSSGGRLTVSLERKKVSAEMNLSQGVLSPDQYTVLSVSDTGPGISAELASRVFEPYFTTKAQGEGSGMGLAIVYNLAKANDALIDMKTAIGEGTCFTLYFKEAFGSVAAPKEVDELAPIRGNGERVLLIDDDVDILESIQLLLSNIGYHVTAYSDPAKALEAFKQAPTEFDLLVSDQSMPKISGIAFLRVIRAEGYSIPAIICSGYSDVISEKDLEDIALDAVIRKPFRIHELSKVISQALSA